MGDGLTVLDRFPGEDVRLRRAWRAIGNLGILLNGASSGLAIGATGLSVLIKAGGGLAVDATGMYSTISTATFIPYTGAANDVNLGTHAFTTTGIITASYFKTSTAPTAVSTGTVTIVAKDAALLTPNAGWLPFKRSDGTIVYVPYWT